MVKTEVIKSQNLKFLENKASDEVNVWFGNYLRTSDLPLPNQAFLILKSFILLYL